MTSFKEELIDNAEKSGKVLFSKQMLNYSDFSEYIHILLFKYSLNGKRNFTCWLNTDFLYKEDQTTVNKFLNFFKKLAKENNLEFRVNNPSEPNNPLISLHW